MLLLKLTAIQWMPWAVAFLAQIKDRSSSYSQESEVRKEGSFIYEEFLATDGTDVKVTFSLLPCSHCFAISVLCGLETVVYFSKKWFSL